MLSWTIGQVTVSALAESQFAVAEEIQASFLPQATPDALRAIGWLAPHFVDEAGRLRMANQALLVEAPGLRLIVDTCIGEEREAVETASFLQALTAAGWSRESVDMVLCTHLHFDHVGWNTCREGDRWVPTFPKARYLFGRTEFEHWSGEKDEGAAQVLSVSVQPILEAGLAEFVETDHRISPELRLVPTLGHTPGHVSVVIESDGERAIITGDMTHHPCQIAHPEWGTTFDVDGAAAIASREALFARIADTPTLVIGTHFSAPTAGHVLRDGERYRFA